jgi:hypothetical protein
MVSFYAGWFFTDLAVSFRPKLDYLDVKEKVEGKDGFHYYYDVSGAVYGKDFGCTSAGYEWSLDFDC